jgi:hypothetical protein
MILTFYTGFWTKYIKRLIYKGEWYERHKKA